MVAGAEPEATAKMAVMPIGGPETMVLALAATAATADKVDAVATLVPSYHLPLAAALVSEAPAPQLPLMA